MPSIATPRPAGIAVPPWRATPVHLVLLAASYALLAQALWSLGEVNASLVSIWPAAGLALAVATIAPRRDRIAVLAVVFAADLAVSLLNGAPPGAALPWAAARTLEPLFGALALHRLFRRRGPGLESPARSLRFSATVALAGAPLAALIGAIAAHAALEQSLPATWRTWYVADVLGMLLVAPVLFVWPRLRAAVGPAFIGSALLTALVATAIFSDLLDARALQPYLLGPALALAAFAHGAPGAAVAGLLGVGLAAFFSGLGQGPYAIFDDDPAGRGPELQLFAAVQLLTVQVFAGLRTQLLEVSAHAERLGAQQLVDPLTGAGNRRCLDEALEQVTSPVKGSGATPAAVLFLDLDGFKPINDLHGHAVGDEVLRIVAERLIRMVRAGDKVARPGGDEFVIVCPALDEPAALHLAERVAERIAEPMAVGGIALRVGASVGTAWIPEPTGRPADLLRAADEAMYRVKAGRR